MQKKYVPFVLFFTLLLVFAAHLGAQLVRSAPAFTFAAEKRVYLTFDDGPSTVVTNRILDTLQRENVRATFFLVSDRAAGREETVRRIAAEGHSIGVHSATHDYAAIYASDEALLADADRCKAALQAITGRAPHLYRLPGGGGTDAARRTRLMEEHGYTVVGWNAVCGDAERGATADTLLKTSIETAAVRNSVVLLLHDGAFHDATARALPQIIAWFRGHGYAFCAFA